MRKLESAISCCSRAERLSAEEKKLWSMGYEILGGIDEVGRGPLAGPVVAACVLFPKEVMIDGVDDSKKLSAIKREALFSEIMRAALAVGIGKVDAKIIDEINVLNATRQAMRQALENCTIQPDFLIIDALTLNGLSMPQLSLIKGDERSHCVAAASIVAKVIRDREMLKWHNVYPEYRFDKHKGYGTDLHINAIKQVGISPIHRNSFCTKHICGG